MCLNRIQQKLSFLRIFEFLLLPSLNALVVKLTKLTLVGTWSQFLFSVSKPWLQNELLHLAATFKQPRVFRSYLFAFCIDLYLKCDCEAESYGQSDGLILVSHFELNADLLHLVTDLLDSSLNAVD